MDNAPETPAANMPAANIIAVEAPPLAAPEHEATAKPPTLSEPPVPSGRNEPPGAAAPAEPPAPPETPEPPPLAQDVVARVLAEAPWTGETRAAATTLWEAANAGRETPQDEPLWRNFIAELRRRRHREAAFAVADALAHALPREVWPLNELAVLCGPATDQPEALAVGRRLFAAAPENPGGPRLISHALRALGHPEEAQAFLDSLPPAFANEDWFLTTSIHLAWARGLHERVIACAAQLRQVSPERTMGYTMGSMAHRARTEYEAAEALMQQALATLAGHADVWGEAARVAQTMDRHELAFERWGELRRRFPRSPAGYIGAIQLSQRVGQPDQTDILVAEGLKAFPGNRDIAVHAARNAMESVDLEGAKRHWQTAIDATPNDPALRVRAAMSMLGSGHLRRKRLPEVTKDLARITTDFPDYIPGCIAHLKLLRDANRFDEAEALAESWGERFPEHQGLAIARARIAENRGDGSAAVARIAQARLLAPKSGPFEAAYVRVLSVAGQHDEAEAACTAAMSEFPDSVDLLCEHSTIAMRRGDWSAALQRAQDALRTRPNRADLRRILQRARIQVVPSDDDPLPDQAQANDAQNNEAGADPAEPQPDPGSAALFSRFESLGATSAGCEFGIVQRRFGCEPLGLLRWAKIDVPGLIWALDHEFEGIGAPENTQLLIREEGLDHQEYYVEDKRLGYSTHTFVTVEDTSFDRMLKQSLRRLTFLSGKLMEDLRAGEKIFVFKLGLKQATLEDLLALHDAICRYAPCTMLCVTRADEAHPKGTLEMLRPGLFLGRAATFMGVGRAGAAGIDAGQWRIYCEQVAAWHDAQRPHELA